MKAKKLNLFERTIFNLIAIREGKRISVRYDNIVWTLIKNNWYTFDGSCLLKADNELAEELDHIERINRQKNLMQTV